MVYKNTRLSVSNTMPTMHLKHEVVAMFLGVQVHVDHNVVKENVRPTQVPGRVSSYSAAADNHLAIMLPSEFHMLTFVVDNGNSVFVHTELCADSLFLVQAQWRFIANVFGSDSVVHGLLYHDKANVPVLGIFDATRLRGVDLHTESLLERHMKIYTLMHEMPHPSIQYHWMGYAKHCHANVRNPNNPFSAHQILVFGQDDNQRVLAGIDTSR